MKKVLWLLLIFILALLQVGVFPALLGNYPSPNLFLALAVALIFRGYFQEALWVSFSGGLFWDFFAFSLFGLRSVVLVFLSLVGVRVFRVLGSFWLVFLLLCFGLSFAFRCVFGFPGFSPLFILGGLIDVFFSLLFYFFTTSVWERIYQEKDQQLDFRLRE